jgi:peptidoglycan/xylan/chitin deacetylase (PgdA/CDA1 family)
MKPVNYLYPNGGKRALTFSFDDSHASNRRVVETFTRYGLTSTFHLNTGMLDNPDYLRSEEIAELFSGHEIAGHTVDHPFLSQQPPEAALRQLLEDRTRLEQLAGYPVRGFSYPFGDCRANIEAMVKIAGYDYARTCNATYDVHWPDNFLHWPPSGHYYEIDQLLPKIKEVSQWHPVALLYLWGHAFEFDRNNNWNFFDNMCEKIGEIPGLWYATNMEVMDYITALRSLRWSVDGSMVSNPSNIQVMVEIEASVIAIKPGFNRLRDEDI